MKEIMLTTISQKKSRESYDSISTDVRRMLVKMTIEDGISIRKASKIL